MPLLFVISSSGLISHEVALSGVLSFHRQQLKIGLKQKFLKEARLQDTKAQLCYPRAGKKHGPDINRLAVGQVIPERLNKLFFSCYPAP